MNKIKIAIAALTLCLATGTAFAQVTGIQTVPGSFASIEAAVTALNASGVGAGGATINVAAGYTETPTAPLVLTMSTNTPSLANPLVIQKSGSGSNPLITAPVGVGTIDGLFVLNGVDYVTINGIDLQENAANVTTTTQMEFGYALLKAAATNGSSFNTIKNCTVTLNKTNASSAGIYLGNHTTTSATTLTISSIGGTSSYNKFYNNTVQNCYTGISITGYGSAAPYDFYDQGNEIGRDGVSTNRSRVLNYGGGVAVASGISATNQNGLKIFNTYINITGGAASTGTVNGINTITGTNSNLDIYGDTVIVSSSSTTGSTMVAINNGMGGTGAGNTVNIYNNVVDGCTYTTNTSGIFRGIASTATASFTNMYGNKVTNNSIPGTGEFSGIYYGGSSVNVCLNVNLNDNIISGNTKTGTAGTFYMLYASSSVVTMNAYNNQMFNNSASASTSGMYGYYNFAFALNENVYNNQVYNNTGGTGETIMLYVRSGSGPTNKEVYGNSVYNITANTATNFGAIWVDYGTIANVYKNNIYNITNNTLTGTAPAVFGIWAGQNVNTQVTISNNFISELKAPSASNVNAIYGIFLSGNSGSTSVLNAYYNTVYLNATSIGANFGSAAIYCLTTTFATDLRNNILVNVSTPTGTGSTKAIWRSSTTATTYGLTSGYNCLYAGTPSATNLIYSDGTNNAQTLQAFKNLIGPREQSSFTTLPPFVNVAVAPYNLHLQNTIATQCEGGAFAVASITTDYDGTTRNSTTPDVGADEISGITVDIAAPNIQYTLLTNSAVAANRPCANFATITDPSGINTTIGTRPRMYYKRSTNANTYNSNTNGTDGWKYVEASNTSSPFSFTIDYSLLFGGGVVAGDIIQYFVVAQDLAGTPIVGLNNGGFTVQPSTVNLAAANFPLNNTINQYTIVAAPLTGTINVGPTETITSLTNVGGAFQLINASVLSGNVILNITGDLTAETGTVALNQWAEQNGTGYTVTISPSAAVVRNIYGNSAAAALIRFDGADRVNIDGRFASAGQYLMFRNTSNTAPTIGYINDAQNNTLQYSIIESGNTATSTTLGGAILIGTTTGANGNDNITISNNEIRDRSDVAGTPNFGINAVGTNGIITQYNDNVVISNNNIHDWYLLNGTAQYAISMGVGNSAFTISGNSFYQTASRTHTLSGSVTRAINISFASTVNSNGGHTISGNFIGGTAPGATGGDMTIACVFTQTFGGINVTTGLIPNSIQGNVIRKIDFTTGGATAAATIWFGISVAQGYYNIGNVTGNVIGDATGNDHIKLNINANGSASSFFAGILAAGVNSMFNIQNNTIGGITFAGTNTTSALIPQWIQIQGTPAANVTITNNLIGSTTTANSIRNNITGCTQIQFGIRHLINTGVAATITGNTVQNITDNSTSVSTANYGVLVIGSVGPQGTLNVSNNTIKDLAIASAPTNPVLGNIGIAFQGYAGINHTVSGNIISGINATNTGAFSNYCVGIQTQGNSMGGTMSKNQIFDLRNVNTGNPGIAGIYISAGLNWTFSNNMISLSNAANSNAIDLTGISDVMGTNSTANYYYNSIYLAGSASGGAANSFPYIRYGTANVTLRDNLLYNRRTGGTGVIGAISNGSGVVTGWPSSASNYNAFIVGDTSRVASWGVPTYNMANWRITSGGDLNSISEGSANVPFSALFVSVNTGNLHINTSTYPEALGTPVAGVTVDFDNNARSATFPTIGADELACSAIAFNGTALANVSCNGGSNGTAIVAGTGGNGITYSWAPTGGTAATATGLAAGTYTCTITNICGNTGTVTVTITEPAVVSATASATNVTCNGANNGSATITAAGGNGVYTYAWSSGGTAATESNLAPGTYTCTITDGNSCTGTQTVTITEPTLLVASAVSQTNVACNGGNNGDATVSASGGTPGYSYSWSSGGTAATETGLGVGTVTCTITDANGCTATQTFSIIGPNALAASSTQTDVSCFGGSNGDATVTVTGGTPSYSYVWSSGGTAATESGLAAGTYTCNVTDANGCAFSQTVTITEPPVLTIAAASNNVSCNAGTNGDATVTVGGGTPSYTYSWSSGGTAATETGLAAGTYTCNVTDANGCTISETVSITEPTALAIVTSQTDVSCNGGTNGTATVSVSGGTPGYAYSWTSGGTAATETGLAIGSYTCTVTDTNGCVATQAFTISEPAILASTVSSTDPASCAGTDGTVDLTPTGGTSPYTYSWSNSATTEDLTGLASGTYTVTITDVNGCTTTATATLVDPTGPTVTVAMSVDTVCTTDPSFTLTGGSPAGGTYSGTGVSAGSFLAASAVNGWNVITYSYTDANSCSATAVDSIYVDLCSGLPENNPVSEFNLYPNPNNGAFTIELNTATIADVYVYDAIGQLVSAEKVQPHVLHQMNLQNSGAYMITVVTAEGQRTSKRVIVTR